MKSKLILASLIISLSLISCKKDDFNNENPTPNRPNSISELKAAPNFSWQTTKNVVLKLKGSHIMTTTVKSINGDVFFKGLIKPESEINTTIALPATINEVVVTYGPFTKTIEIVNNSVSYNFNLNSY